jgi:hypothetical protein
MSGSTRRNFLIASGAAGVAAAVSTSAHAAAAGPGSAPPVPEGAEPLIAHVLDPASGHISLLIGEREVEITDADLVSRLARAAAKGD